MRRMNCRLHQRLREETLPVNCGVAGRLPEVNGCHSERAFFCERRINAPVAPRRAETFHRFWIARRPPLLPRPPNCGTVKHKGRGAMNILSCQRRGILSLLFFLFCLCAFPARAQEEIVANLAAGRVVIDVARDGIVIGAVEQRIEADSRPPLVFPLNDRRIAILLGAAEWTLPGTGLSPVRLDRVIPRISSEAVRVESRGNPDQAGDIESIGVAFLEKLRTMAEQLHHKIALGPDEPLVRLVLVDYQPDYGPEVWLLEYRIQQQALRGDFYQTRTLRPSYTQLYPPEKHQPRTLVEIRYPPEAAGPTVLELLRQNDPLLAPLRQGDPKLLKVIESLESGKSQTVPVDSAARGVHRKSRRGQESSSRRSLPPPQTLARSLTVILSEGAARTKNPRRESWRCPAHAETASPIGN